MVTETTKPQRNVKKLQKRVEDWRIGAVVRRRSKVLDEIDYLLSKQSVAKWPSLLEDLCGVHGEVVEDLYSIFTFQSDHNLRFEISRL